MAAVATVAINVDAANAVQGLNRVQTAAKGASSAFNQLSERAKAVKAIVEAQQGSFAKASTVQGVFSARVLNTEAAILAQIAALREVQKNVQLGGALYKKAGAQIEEYKNKIKAANTATKETQSATQAASTGVKGLGAALQSALGPLLTITTAFATLKAAVDTAFERGAAEQRLKNLTSGTEEYNVALALAADSAQKFGLTQTQTTGALADVFSRLKGVGFGLKETSEIYQGFNTIALRSGLVGEEAAGAFFQLSQALGKGKLNGDEFVTIAERLPQLLDAIAQTTGASRGELSQLAQEGKITSQVLFEALSGAANASGELGAKLTAQQKAFNNLKQVSDQLLNSLGKVFGPVVVASANVLADIGQQLADYYSFLGKVIFPQVVDALAPVITSLQAAFEDINFDAIRVAIQGILIQGFQIAIGVISNFSKVLGVVIDAFKGLSQNPVFQFIADQVGRLANFLGLTTDRVGDFKNAQQQVTKEAAASVDKFSKLPAPIADSKEESKRLKEAQKAVNDEIQRVINSADKLNQSLTANVESQLQISQARFEAEKAINDVLLQQAQSQLSAAQSQEERIKAAQNILTLTIEQAKLELQSTKATIAAELDKAKIAVTTAQLKERELTAIVNLAIAQGTVNDKFLEALNNQRQALRIAKLQFDTVSQVAKQQGIAADAVFRGKVAAAEAAFQQNILAKNTQESAKAASAYADEMERGANATERAASASSGGARGTTPIPEIFGEAGRNPLFAREWYDAVDELNRAANTVSSFNRAYNELLTGFLTKAQEFNQAKAAERMQSAAEDWITTTGDAEAGLSLFTRAIHSGLASTGALNQAQLEAARALREKYGLRGRMQAYAPSGSQRQEDGVMPGSTSTRSGAPSAINPQVSITTGPVMQMGNETYVTKRDLMSATQQAARQGANMAMSMLQNDPKVRRRAGVLR